MRSRSGQPCSPLLGHPLRGLLPSVVGGYCAGRAICASFAPLAVYIYGFGGESCTTRLTLLRSARLRPRPWPRLAPSGAGPRRRPLVTHFGEKRGSSRALHPPSASRCFVGGIPPPRLVRAWCRITRTVAVPFPCVRSFRPSTWARPSIWSVFLRSSCARRRSVSSLSSRQMCRDFVRTVISRSCNL